MNFKKIYLFLLIVVALAPWFNSDSINYISIPEIRQEENTFYEINPCKISLFEFIKSNPKSIYQDHYYFRPNDNSSIGCFGRISGVSVQQLGLETQFFISVGTNSFINLLLQASFWLLCIKFIPVNKILIQSKKDNYFDEILVLLTAFFLSYSIYAQQRFYNSSFYFFDFNERNSYLIIFLIFWLIIKNIVILFNNRNENFLNYLPFMLIFTFIFSGFNLNLFSLLVIFLGLKQILSSNKLYKFNRVYLLFALWWLFNSHGKFYFNVGKLRSFTSSSYDFNSNLYWIVFFILLINGLFEIFNQSNNNFNFLIFTKNISISTTLLLLFGLVGSNFPIISFFQYYFLGLQRYVVNMTNPFLFDEYSVKVSWRGIFPSSETVGELFGISLLLILYHLVQTNKMRLVDIIGIISAGFGLYFSDNKTSIVLVFLISISYLIFDNLKLSYNNKLLAALSFSLFTITVLFLVIGGDNLFSSYEFMRNSLISKAEAARYDSIYSSFVLLIQDSQTSKTIINVIFGIFSSISFLLNRSEMWGIFFARYNPTFMELIAGSGPLNFGQLYGEVLISNQTSFLLPHSSLLSYLVFFGIVPLVYFMFRYFIELKKNWFNKEYIYLLIYIFVNVIKNDSLNYFVMFTFYYVLLFLFRNFKQVNMN